MKIFYVDPQSYNNLADYDKYLLENMDSHKYYFCSDKFPFNEVNNAEIKKIYSYQNFSGVKKIISYLKSQYKLLKIVKEEKPDIVHFQWFKIPVFDFYLLKRIKAVSKKTKIVHTAHNVLPHDSGSKYEKIYNKLYHYVDKLIVHANVTKQEIIEQFNIEQDKLIIIPHGFLPSKVKVGRNKNTDVITFSFIGFLSEYKGLDILLDAWCHNEKIINSNKIELIIAGAGDLPCLHSIPENKNIRVENYFHSEQELAQIIANTDVTVLPYRKISQSGVLLTFLAEKVPVIVSNIGGLTQPFELGNVGWILQENKSSEIESILLQIVENPETLLKIKNDNELWMKIENFYDWKNISIKTYNMYENLI